MKIARRTHSDNRCQSGRCNQIRAARGLHRSRRGVLTIQLILALPILLLATLAVIEFGVLMLVHHATCTAAIEGSREAEKGADCNQVAGIVAAYLSAHGLEITPHGPVRVVCEKRIGGVTHVESRGNGGIACQPNGGPLNNGEVRVTVCAKASDGVSPVPDWLAVFGFSLSDRVVSASSLTYID